jgi:type IV pilus assembly protein PilC
MPVLERFSYRAVAPGDEAVVKGTMDAANEAAAVGKIHAQGLIPLEVRSLARTGLRREVSLTGSGRVKVKALALMTRQMAALTEAGLPLLRTLEILTEQTDDKALRAALVGVVADVESGASLSLAFSRQPKVFAPLMVSLVRVGEAGGFLAESLTSIARFYKSEAELRDKVRAATTYPTVVLVVALLAVLGMVTFIVPVFEKMFANLGGELPVPTQILVTISHNMVWILPLLAVVLIGGAVWWTRSRNTPRVRAVVDPWKLRLPIFGSLNTKIAVARFARNLSMMLQAGVPLMQALDTVGEAANNVKIVAALEKVKESVRQGKSLAAPLAAAGVFPPMVSQMVSVGEESGTLTEMLDSIATFYEAEVASATEQLTAVIEPVLIVILGVVIGGMVISLYLPVFNLYAQLNHSAGA